MKRFLLLMALAGMLGAAAAEMELKKWDLGLADGRKLYVTQAQTVKTAFADEVFTLTVNRNEAGKRNPSHIQFWPIYSAGFKAGVSYRSELTVKASADVTIQASIMLNGKPYSTLAKQDFALKANEPMRIVLEFTPKADISAVYRVPCLFLGNADAGTVFEISNAKLSSL